MVEFTASHSHVQKADEVLKNVVSIRHCNTMIICRKNIRHKFI